jgi:hypothetical protein
LKTRNVPPKAPPAPAKTQEPKPPAAAPTSAGAGAWVAKSSTPARAALPSREAVQDADTLHRAMTSGLFTGQGTDEDTIWEVMSKRNPAGLAELAAAYTASGNGNLQADLKSELSSEQYQAITLLFAGKLDQAAAVAIKSGLAKPIDVLRKLPEDKLLPVARAYLSLDPSVDRSVLNPSLAFLSRIRGKLSVDETGIAAALLKKAAANAGILKPGFNPEQVANLSDAEIAKIELGAELDRWAPSRAAIFNALEKVRPSARAWILNDASLMKKLEKQLPGVQLERAMAILRGDASAAQAAVVRSTMLEHPQTPTLGVVAQALGTDGNGKGLAEAFERQTGRPLASMVPPRDHPLLAAVTSNQPLTPEQQLRLDGLKLLSAIAQKDFETAKGALEGKTKAQLGELTRMLEPALRTYEGLSSQARAPLKEHIENAFSGREQFDLLQMLSAGKPESPREELDQLKAKAGYERSRVVDGVQWIFRGESEGARLQSVLEQGESSLKSNPALTPLVVSVAAARTQGYVATKDDAAETLKQVGTYGTMGVGVVAAPFTGGASVGLTVGAAAMVAAPIVGAGAKLIAKGSSTTRRELASEATGAALGVAANLIPVAGRAALVANAARAGLTAGAVEAGNAAVAKGTWDDGAKNGLIRVGERGAIGVGAGAASAVAAEVAAIAVGGIGKSLKGVVKSPAKAVEPRPPAAARVRDAAPQTQGPADKVYRVAVKGDGFQANYDVKVSPSLAKQLEDKDWTLDPTTFEVVLPNGTRRGVLGQEAYKQATGRELPKGLIYDAKAMVLAAPRGEVRLVMGPDGPTFIWPRGSTDLSGPMLLEKAAASWSRPVPPAAIEQLKPRWQSIQREWAELQKLKATAKPGDPRLKALQAAQAAAEEERMSASGTVQGTHGAMEATDGAAIASRNWKAAEAKLDSWVAEGKPFSTEAMAELNAIFGNGLENNRSVPGFVRTEVNVSAGGSAKHAYVYAEQVEPALAEFNKWYAGAIHDGMPPVQLAALSFQRLISIHPFPDANGRTTRAIMDWTLKQAGLPPATFAPGGGLLGVFGRIPHDKSVSPERAVAEVTEAIERTLSLYQGVLK